MCVCVCGRGSLSYLYRIPTLALSFHSDKNVKLYIFVRSVGLLARPLIITGNKQITDNVYNEAQLIINCYVLILKSFDKMISNFRDSICYATRINSIEDADHICNGVKPQPFVFVCTEHLKCLTKIFGIGLTSCLQLPFQRT